MPSTDGSSSRGRPSRRATISAREGSPSRAGSVADISTPIAVPCIASAKRGRDAGSAARRIACHDTARSTIEAHISAIAEQHPGGARGEHRRGDGVPADALRRRGRRRPSAANAAPTSATRRPTCAARARRLARGSSDGSRRAGRRGPPAAERRPKRTAKRAGGALGLRHRDRVLVGLDHALGDARPRVLLGGPAGALAEALEPRRVERELVQRLGQGERVAARHQQAVARRARRRRDSRRCPTRRPACPAAKASVSTIPNDSPPSDGARSTCARASAARFSSSSTRPSARHAARVGEQRRQRGLVDADDGQLRGMCSRRASKARSSTGRPLRSTAWPTNAISSGSPGARRRGAGAPPRAASRRWARSGTRRRRSAARSTPPPRTPRSAREPVELALDPHSHATACGRSGASSVVGADERRVGERRASSSR